MADRQPKPTAPGVATACRIGTVQRLKESRRIGCQHAGRAVFQVDQHIPTIDLQRQAHAPWRVRVAQAVVQQIAKQLFDASAVPAHGYTILLRCTQLQRQAQLLRAQLKALQHLLRKRQRILLLKIAGQGLQVGHRQQVQVFHQRAQVQHLLAQRHHGRRLQRTHAIDQRLDLATQYRQRRAQLVRNISNPAAPLRIELRQRLRHGVDVAHQVTYFIGARRVQANRELALCNAQRCLLRREQRAHPAPGHPPGTGQRKHQQGQGNADNPAVLRVQELGIDVVRHHSQLEHARQRNELATHTHGSLNQCPPVGCQSCSPQGFAVELNHPDTLTKRVGPGVRRTPIGGWSEGAKARSFSRRWATWSNALAQRKLIHQTSYIQPTLSHGLQATGLLGALTNESSELLQALHIARNEVIGKTIAQIPGRHGTHGQHRQQHG